MSTGAPPRRVAAAGGPSLVSSVQSVQFSSVSVVRCARNARDTFLRGAESHRDIRSGRRALPFAVAPFHSFILSLARPSVRPFVHSFIHIYILRNPDARRRERKRRPTAWRAAMANLRQTPLTCSGHTRPVVHLAFSDVTGSGYYLISACKGIFPLLSPSRPLSNVVRESAPQSRISPTARSIGTFDSRSPWPRFLPPAHLAQGSSTSRLDGRP